MGGTSYVIDVRTKSKRWHVVISNSTSIPVKWNHDLKTVILQSDTASNKHPGHFTDINGYSIT